MDKRRYAVIASLITLSLTALYPADVTVSQSTSTFAPGDDGSFDPYGPGFGFSLTVSERISEALEASVSVDRDANGGNLLSARGIYRTPLLAISAGPSFGIFNSTGDDDAVTPVIQPGLGVGFEITAPGILVLKADTDFAIPTATETPGQAFIQRGEISAGFYMPNVLCSLKARQRNQTEVDAATTLTKSITDYGLFTEAFLKGSPFRFGVNFIYRVVDYRNSLAPAANRSFANLVLGGGLTWKPKADLAFFASGSGALYTFSLDDNAEDVDSFLFDLSVGARFTIPTR
jgi:hypothetical protein